jgi:hypothetical protein
MGKWKKNVGEYPISKEKQEERHPSTGESPITRLANQVTD